MFPKTTDAHLRRKKASERTAEKIRSAIARGTLRSGDLLPSEARLMEKFSVSRSTIREALRLLESEDLVSVSLGAHGGARVLTPAIHAVARAFGIHLQRAGSSLDDLYDVRILIEPAAVKVLTDRNASLGSSMLRQQYELLLKEQENLDAAMRIMYDFHKVIVEQCKNESMRLFAEIIHDLVENHLYIIAGSNLKLSEDFNRKRVAFALSNQRALIEQVELGNGQSAHDLWKEYLISVKDYWDPEVDGKSTIEAIETFNSAVP